MLRCARASQDVRVRRPSSTSPDPAVARILAVVDGIPPGRLATYGQVAAEAGLPGRARLVGRVLAELAPASDLPWQRVVRSDGTIAPRPGDGRAEQARRLRREGVAVRSGWRVDLTRHRWIPE